MEQGQVTPAGGDPVHLSFSEQRQPVIRGAGGRYLLARGDQLAFAAEVVRFGFAPDDFVLDIARVRGNRSASRNPGAKEPDYSTRGVDRRDSRSSRRFFVERVVPSSS